MRHFDLINPPCCNGKGSVVQSEEWIRATMILDAMAITLDTTRLNSLLFSFTPQLMSGGRY